MHLDGFFFNCLVREINSQISGSRVEDVYDNQLGNLLLQFRAPGRTLRLEVSVTSPPFSFFLSQGQGGKGRGILAQTIKKHVGGLFCLSISNDPFDRRAVLALSPAPAGSATAHVHIEIMGRQNDLILCLGSTIIASTRPPRRESDRPLQPGDLFTPPPPAAKLPPETFTSSMLATLFKNIGALPVKNALTRGIMGVSPLLAQEICHRAQVPPELIVQHLSPAALEKLTKKTLALAQASLNTKVTAAVYDKAGPYWTGLEHLDGTAQEFANLSPALEYWQEAFRSGRDSHALRSGLQAALSAAQDKQGRTLTKQNLELKRAQDHERLRQIGETILASINEIPRGATEVNLGNIHTGQPLKILLDPEKSPSSNAAYYFKRYHKFKNALAKVKGHIARGQEQVEYLNSLEYAVDAAATLADLMEIRQEMEDQGLLRRRKKAKSRPLSQQKYLTFTSPQGDMILVGKNNRQNEELTLRKADKNHYWLHSRHYPGSHVILCTKSPDPAALEFAASLAAWYSKARSSPKVEVVWTQVKNVKKLPGAKPGMVQYADYRSALVTPRPYVDNVIS